MSQALPVITELLRENAPVLLPAVHPMAQAHWGACSAKLSGRNAYSGDPSTICSIGCGWRLGMAASRRFHTVLRARRPGRPRIDEMGNILNAPLATAGKRREIPGTCPCALDTNDASEVFGCNRPPAGIGFFDWINTGNGHLVVGGRLLVELDRGSQKMGAGGPASASSVTQAPRPVEPALEMTSRRGSPTNTHRSPGSRSLSCAS